MEEQYQCYLNEYLKSLPAQLANKYTSFSAGYFCADEYNANICAELILRGKKRASCSMDYWYSHMGESRPQVGHLHVVTDWQGLAVCIIEITAVNQCKYNAVSAEFASDEGEGDQSLRWWREAHWDFFTQECNELGIEPTQDMLLVLETFKVVYPYKQPAV